MHISEERLEEFRRIYQEVHGEEIEVGAARIMAGNLIQLYLVLMRPLPDDR